MSRKRIFFFNRFFWPDQSATAQILTDLCRGLESSGYEITVVTSRLDYGNKTIQYQGKEQLGEVEIIRLWSTRFGRGNILGRLLDYLTIYYSFFAYILRNLSSDDIVVLKTDPPLLSILGALGRSVKQFRLVSWCQDIFPEVAMAEMRTWFLVDWIFRFLKLLRDWSLHRSDRVVVLGRDMGEYLAGREIAPVGIIPISNWSVQEDSQETRERELRKEWGIPDETFVIGYSGNLGRAHDWETIFTAAKSMKDERGILFLLCGGGYGYEQLQQAVIDNELEDLFLFQPYQAREDLASSLRVPDVHWFTLKERLTPFIFPSKFFGILQAGRPVLFIGDTTCEIADVIRSNGIGGGLREGDVEGLVAAIHRLKASSPALEELGTAARKLWETRFQKANEIAKWDQMLKDLGSPQA